MDFLWSEAQISFAEKVEKFAQALPADIVDRDKTGVFDQAAWVACADWGIQALAAPAAYGGRDDHDLLTSILAMEALGRGCRDLGLLLGLSAQMWTVQVPIATFGTENQKARFLPPLCRGEMIAAHALTEVEAGSDNYAMATRAEPTEGGYLLTGKKVLITLAPIADLALIFATTNSAKGRWGITAFLVSAKSDGYQQGVVQDKMGLRTVPIGEINLDGCFVPDENRLGAEGAGLSIIQHTLEYDRCGILAGHVGAMQRQLDEAVQFAKSRKQFGQPIAQFQAVSHRLADMKLRLETARLLLYKVAWLKQNDIPATLEAAMLKLFLSESFVASSLDSLRTHGGLGYLSDSGVERYVRDAIGGVVYAGTSDIQRNIIARMLGL